MSTKRQLKDRISKVRINNYLGVQCVCERERKTVCFSALTSQSSAAEHKHMSRSATKTAD